MYNNDDMYCENLRYTDSTDNDLASLSGMLAIPERIIAAINYIYRESKILSQTYFKIILILK